MLGADIFLETLEVLTNLIILFLQESINLLMHISLSIHADVHILLVLVLSEPANSVRIKLIVKILEAVLVDCRALIEESRIK